MRRGGKSPLEKLRQGIEMNEKAAQSGAFGIDRIAAALAQNGGKAPAKSREPDNRTILGPPVMEPLNPFAMMDTSSTEPVKPPEKPKDWGTW